MKTIAEFVEENNLGSGDSLTDGIHTWRIYKSSYGGKYYLNNQECDSGHIGDQLLDTVIIKNLKVIETKLTVAQFTVRLEEDPELRVTPYFFEHHGKVKQYYADKKLTLLKSSRIGFTVKRVTKIKEKINYP